MQIANTIVKYGGARINISCLEWTVFGPMPEKNLWVQIFENDDKIWGCTCANALVYKRNQVYGIGKV